MIAMPMKDVASAVGVACEAPQADVIVRGVSIDSRTVRPGDLFVAIRGDRFDGHKFIAEALSKGAVACVGDRAWSNAGGSEVGSVPCLVVGDTAEALGNLARFYRRHVMPVTTVVVAVTGSNGKTTTKHMIDHALGVSLDGRAAPGSYNNHIGVPLTLLSAERDDRYLVVEVGTNSPGEVAHLTEMAAPDVGVITSIAEAHLQGLGGIEGVAAEKVSLLRYVPARGLAVVNIDRPEIRSHLVGATSARIMTVGGDPSADLHVADAAGDMHKTTFLLDGRFRIELPMPGMHHAANAAAAFAVARWFGLAPEMIIERLRTYRPIPGRTRVLDFGGLTVVDDTYNANPASIEAAVLALQIGATGRRVFVMGDMMELGPGQEEFHRRVVVQMARAGIEVLIAVGETTAMAARDPAVTDSGMQVVACDGAESASDALVSTLTTADTVWIKGSRAMGLDRIVDALRMRFAPETAVA